MKAKKLKILVGMSGGVDSSVASFLLQKEGYEVYGVFIDFIGGEKGEQDFQKAQEIAKKINISIYKIDAMEMFRKKIIDEFVNDYRNGITPNPCVICNPEVKFKILIEEADKIGADLVATGHYARVRELKIKNKKLKIKESHQSTVIVHQLFVARDINKDQSYFLYRLNQKQLRRIIFPLGIYKKDEVRKIAEISGFEFNDKKESQDVCFIADNDFGKFIGGKIKNNPGDVVDMNGIKLGEHTGLHFYTIGQRKGINLGGNGPYYVIKKDNLKNQLIVSNNPKDLICSSGVFKISKANWINFNQTFPFRSRVKTRYRSQEVYAIIDKEKDDFFLVKLEDNQKSITPGQSAVFWDEEGGVIGGGIII